MIELHLGDCLEILSTMPEMSVDAIVTDPPYGLSFMGKKWDYDVPDEAVWQECLRVLKPGGHLLCFAGTRTQHRMAVRIEDAGFEIRDMIAWVYGCLSEDTEILTANGWEQYHSAIDKSPVLCYNVQNDSFEYHKPTEKFCYENKHTAYRIQSDTTDQIVSRNHRCLVEQGGKLIFKRAETLQQQENIPVLENVSMLQQTFYDYNKGAGDKEQILFKGMQVQNDRESKQREKANPTGVRGMQEDVLSRTSKQEQTEKNLQSGVQRCIKGGGMESSCTQGEIELDGKKRNGIKGKNDGGNQSFLEGRNNLFQEKGDIFEPVNKICKMSDRIQRDGKERRICDGTQVESCYGNKKTLDENGMCTPLRPRCDKQQYRKLDAIQNECGTQEVRTRSGYKTTLATVTETEYNGKVWCVTVPTGAFVARRNGKIFITGNSGFPKSLDVSKAIDKAAGAEREVVGVAGKSGSVRNSMAGDFAGGEYMSTAPVTPEAKQWDGWGTALKPALEPITVARKPLIGTVAENVLQHGTGAINVDGCRVGEFCNTTLSGIQRWNDYRHGHEKYLTEQIVKIANGRFPANFIHDGSEEVVGLFPVTKPSKATQRGSVKIFEQGEGQWIGESTKRGHDDSGGSAARFFYCAKASKADRDEGCEGLQERSAGECVDRVIGSAGMESPRAGAGRTSGSRNHHPTVKPTDLMRYLCRLVTPPGGIVLDPFMGSGSTGKAAMLEGFNFIGIEREPEYMEIAKARIHAAIPTDNATVYEQLSLRYL